LKALHMNTPKLVMHLMLALLFTHELDAMAQSEWRLLYVLRGFSDEQGRRWFVALHVPLFGLLLALLHHGHDKLQQLSRIGFSLFYIVYVFLHWRLHNDPLSTFTTVLSWSLIIGAGLLGVAYLGIVALRRKQTILGLCEMP
jgi:lysylphosphatidylglycerol synthetase-like protein (DUF2156 family)